MTENSALSWFGGKYRPIGQMCQGTTTVLLVLSISHISVRTVIPHRTRTETAADLYGQPLGTCSLIRVSGQALILFSEPMPPPASRSAPRLTIPSPPAPVPETRRTLSITSWASTHRLLQNFTRHRRPPTPPRRVRPIFSIGNLP